jgi:hypothetical protein
MFHDNLDMHEEMKKVLLLHHCHIAKYLLVDCSMFFCFHRRQLCCCCNCFVVVVVVNVIIIVLSCRG